MGKRKFPIIPVALGSGLGWLISRNFLGVLIGGGAGWIVGKGVKKIKGSNRQALNRR